MKNFILLLAFILISTVHAGTCTSISRTNSASLSVLTSSKYNTDLNTVYTAVNSLDGGCITDGTLESGALNTTQFAPLLKGLHQGCKVIYSSATTVQVDKCLASVNGNFVTTTTTTNATFGCSGCSAEVASTTYYIYIQTGSSGSTLTPLILTTAPNNDGYDNTGNKVLARFYNNGSSDIDQYSIDQWNQNGFVPSGTNGVTWTPTVTGLGTISASGFTFYRQGKFLEASGYMTIGTVAASLASVSLPSSLYIDATELTRGNTTSNPGHIVGEAAYSTSGNKGYLVTATGTDAGIVYFGSINTSANNQTPQNGNALTSSNDLVAIKFRVPIKGWSAAR